MNTIILLIHVLSVITSFIFAIGMIISTKKLSLKKAAMHSKKMWLSTLSTVVSGTLLSFTTASSIGSSCLSLFVFLSAISAINYLQKTYLPTK